MNLNKKRSPKSSLYFYLIAGVYLLYTDYTLISNWEQIESKNKVIMTILAVVFAVSAGFIIIYALKGLKELKENEANLVEETKEIDEADLVDETKEIDEVDKTKD